MKYGLTFPNFDDFSDPRAVGQLAQEAERAGWDGFFLWDHMLFDRQRREVADPWVTLAAVALATRQVRLGPMVTPLARRRPWKVARETVTLDHLSGGRLVLGVGLGAPAEVEFGLFGEDPDPHIRAEKLDEGLTILTGLWTGRPFRLQGRHYRVQGVTFLPPPVQKPRIPIWVAGMWPHRAPFRRAARWDGVFPLKVGAQEEWMPLTPGDVREIVSYVGAHRQGGEPFDVVVPGYTEEENPAEVRQLVEDYAQAGATWWLEGEESLDAAFDRARRGPPLPETE